MDKFVKGENYIWKNASEGTHSNKNSLSISGEESAGLTFGLIDLFISINVIV